MVLAGPHPNKTLMQTSLQAVARVPVFRVALVAISLMVLPSFSVKDRNAVAADSTVSAPVGVTAAAASTTVATTSAAVTRTSSALSATSWDDVKLGSIDSEVFQRALGAARCAVKSGAVSNPATLTVIDYSKPSTANRLWVFDLRKRELMFEELVAHGQGSGANYATMFSNEPDTHRTSIGLFVTDDTYVGRNGYSLRLNGLDEGYNDRARERAIVMHGAPYVNTAFVKTQGRLGRSWGCPALSEGVARQVIDTVKGGSLVFSYYPDQKWLKSSKYLGDCGN
jgi:hypothetical protein